MEVGGGKVTVTCEVTVTCGAGVALSEEGRQAVRIKARKRRVDFFMLVSLKRCLNYLLNIIVQ